MLFLGDHSFEKEQKVERKKNEGSRITNEISQFSKQFEGEWRKVGETTEEMSPLCERQKPRKRQGEPRRQNKEKEDMEEAEDENNVGREKLKSISPVVGVNLIQEQFKGDPMETDEIQDDPGLSTGEEKKNLEDHQNETDNSLTPWEEDTNP